jgi:hypothetical protein
MPNDDQSPLLRRIKHGGRRGGDSDLRRTYAGWRSMRERCLRPRHVSFSNYGGRNITICERWLHGENGMHPFLCFVTDIGLRPPGKTLDRIDPNKNYEPTNARWSTPREQRANQRKVARIEKFTDEEIEQESQQRVKQFRDGALKLRQAATLPADEQRGVFTRLADLCERVADHLDAFAAVGSAPRDAEDEDYASERRPS